MQSMTQNKKLKHLSTQQANAHGVEQKLKIQDDGVQLNVETNLQNTQKSNKKFAFRTNFNEWEYKFPRSYKERYGVEYTPSFKCNTNLWAKASYYIVDLLQMVFNLFNRK
jgi:hypothetical protein